MKILVVVVGFFLWYVIDLDYDASDERSLERMVTWSPSCEKNILTDLAIASDGSPNMENLDGLNCDEIHDEAMEIREKLSEEQLNLLIRRNTGEFFRGDSR